MKATGFVMLLVAAVVLGGSAGYGASLAADRGGGVGTTSLARSGLNKTTSPAVSVEGTGQEGIGQSATQASTGQSALPGRVFAGDGTMGTVQKVEGSVITITARDGATVPVIVGDNTSVHRTVSAAMTDIAAGAIVMATGVRQDDGSVSATSVSIGSQSMAQQGMIGGVGFSRAGTSGAVEKAEGNVITLATADGTTVRVVVNDKTVFQKTVQGSISDITAGLSIIVTGAKNADGSVNASSVTIAAVSRSQSQ